MRLVALSPISTITLAASLMLLGASSAVAQDSESADDVVRAGLSSLQQIDEDRLDDLWEKTSAFVKTKMPRTEFVSGIRQARSTVGPVQKRTWAGIQRIQYPTGSIDPSPGLYANVDYSTRLLDGRTVFEKVTLRMEPDGWRLIGYVPRQQQ